MALSTTLCDVLEEEKLLNRLSSKLHLVRMPSLVCSHDSLNVTSNNIINTSDNLDAREKREYSSFFLYFSLGLLIRNVLRIEEATVLRTEIWPVGSNDSYF